MDKRFENLLKAMVSLLSCYCILLTSSKVSISKFYPHIHLIEEAFSKVKAYLCHHQNLLASNMNGIIYDMMTVMEIITPEDAQAYFRHAGYF